MKRLIGIVWAVLITLGMGGVATAQVADPLANVLSSFDFNIVGVGLKADPEYQAVPKGIASKVNTLFDTGTFNIDEIAAQLPADYTVRAELSGPSFQTPLPLVTKPGKPFDLPTLAIIGKYTLNNIRLVDGSGKTLFGAVPQAVAIESIPDPLVTSVTTRPLSTQELQDRGVTFDSSNFTAYEFTAAIATESGQVPLRLPVLIPNASTLYEPEKLPPMPGIGLGMPTEITASPQTPVPENISISGFMLEASKVGEPGAPPIQLPPIPGIVVIPGNIGFLHQYFSAMAIVTNGAPGQSNLVVKDIQVKIIFPSGADLNPGTDDISGDDPLRMAKGTGGFFPRIMPAMHAGPDGKYGTADDISLLHPAESGQADFTIEGLKEGTHKLDFEITATLEGLPIGPVTLKGKATGAVLVRNPDFSITLGHPATVRSGEAYDLFVTVTNTSQAVANLVSIHLDSRALSGAVFANGEDPDKQIETILSGSSATIKYRVISQRTGKVTATAFASEEVKGRFILRMGVGELGIPLSPDSLILPYTDGLPADLINAAVGLLGQAWSVATAPTGALPADVLPIPKQIITARANDLSEAGLRILLNDTTVKAVEDLAFDFIGSDNANRPFDSLRRRSTQGLNLNNAIAAVFQNEIQATGAFPFQAGLARQSSYRPGHISVITTSAPVRVRLSDSVGNRSGGLSDGEMFREIPYGDQLSLSRNDTGRSTLTLVTKLDAGSYRLDLEAYADAGFDLGIVIPAADGVLSQVTFTGITMPAGAKARLGLTPGGSDFSLQIDTNGDGVPETIIAPAATLVIPDQAPEVVAVTQIVPGFGPGGDKHGRTVAILFSEKVTKVSAQNLANYSVDENAARISYLQPSGRMAFILLRDGIGPFVERKITVSGITDLKQNQLTPVTMPIRTTAKGPAALVNGSVRKASGETIPGAVVRLMQLQWVEQDYERLQKYFIISEKPADANGRYQFDYVLQNDDPSGPFQVEAVDPQTSDGANIITSVVFNEQKLNLDLFMKARGSVSGVVRDAAGQAVASAQVLITTLSGDRSYLAVSDAVGAFSFANVRVGAFTLKAVSQSLFAEGSIMGTLPDNGGSITQDITIYRLSDAKRGNIAGKVLGSDGTPRAGVIVVAQIFEGSGVRYSNWMRSGSDGSYAFNGIFAGKLRIDVKDDASGERTSASGTVLEGGTSVFNIILKGTGTVTGKVEREDGQSVAGLHVIADVDGTTRIVQTDTQGNFTISGVPLGTVSLRVTNPRDFNQTLVSLSVSLLTAGDTANAYLFVPAKSFFTGTIQGTVYRLDGSVFPHATVRLVNLFSNTYFAYKADGEGKYVIPALPMQTHYLTVVNGREIANASTTLWYDTQTRTVDLHPVGMGSVTGTIYDEGSGMIPVGADVALSSMRPDGLGWLRYDRSANVKSDPQSGRYTFTNVYVGDFTVSAFNVLRPTLVSKRGTLTANNETATADLVLKDTFGSISGQVLLPNGTPAGADITVAVTFGGADVVVTTNAEGKFQFRPVIPAGNYSVLVEDLVTTLKGKGYVSVPAGRDVAVTIRLLGRGSMTVRALNADNTIAPNTAISLKGSDFPNDLANGVTGPNGTITFENLTEGRYAISAMGSSNRGGRAEGNIPLDHAAVNVDVRLAPSGSFSGTFFKSDGVTPIQGGQIKLLNSGKQVVAYAFTSTEAATAGQFRLDFVPLGDFTLEGFDPISERRGVGGGKLTSDGETVIANVAVTPIGVVKGRVLNYSGTAPVSNANVRIWVNGVSSYSNETSTSPDGSFLFAGVPAGRFNLDATEPLTRLHGQATGAISYESEIAQTELHIAPTGSIEGSVLMPDRTTPAGSATVTLEESGVTTQVDPATGAFRFLNLAAGKSYSIRANENGANRVGKTITTITGDGEIARADITLRGIGVVEGIVFDTNTTAPLEGARVTIQTNTTSADAYTDSTGSYRFADVPASSFTLRASHPQRLTAASASGTLDNEGQIVDINLTFGSVGSVTGTVVMADGITPARGGVVKFTGGGRTFIAVIDTNGQFGFNNIPLCSFKLSIEDASGLAIGYALGNIVSNGEVVAVGTIILDDKPITVIAVDPVSGAVDIPVSQAIKILFSEPANPLTVNSSTVYIQQGTSRITGSLVLDQDNKGVTFTPSAPLTGFTLYTVVVTTGIQDRVERPLPQTFTSTFSTVDNTPPSVKSVSPSNGTIEVATDGVVRVTFSETIDPANVSGIKLLQGNIPVAAQLDLIQGGTVAVLTPLNPLVANGNYTVSVSNARDMVGNIQQGTFLSSFNTIDTIAPTISSLTVPANADLIRGNTVAVTAVSPGTDVAFVDFYVDGMLTATDTTAPYSMNLLLSKEGAVQVKAVAQDRVGNRWLPVSLDLTVAADQPPTVAFTAPAEGSSVNTGAGFSVTVQGSDDLTVKEIALTVAGEVMATQTKTNLSGKNVSTTFNFTAPTTITQGGNIVLTAIAKDSAGNSSQAALRTLTVHDGIAPVAVSLVSTGQTVKYRPGDTGTATFDATDNVGVTRIACSASGAVTENRDFALPSPQSSVSQEFSFTVPVNAASNATTTISCTAFDAAGYLATRSITLAVADVIPPQVTGASVANNATDVPVGSSISVSFSEALATSSVTASSVVLTDTAGQPVPGSVTIAADRKGITFKPTSALARGAAYTLTVTAAITDAAGNSLAAPYDVFFTTDNTAPSLKTISPASGSQNVPVGSAIAFTFSEAIDPASVKSDSISLSSAFGPVAGTVGLSADNSSAIFKPLGQLSFSRDYTITFKASIADISGNLTAVNYTGAFLTQSPSSDLVGLWTMDGDWSDSSGNGNHGTASGGAAFASDHAGGAMAGSFDGANDYIKVNNSSSLNPTAITVEAWAKSATPMWGSGSIASKYGAYTLRPVEGSKELRFYAGSQYAAVNDPDLDPTQWHHYAGTYDGFSIKLYVDGVVRSTVAYNGNLYTAGTNPLYIGWDDWQTWRYFKGLIDEVAVYKQALPAEDIFEHYHAALTSDRLPPAPPTVNAVESPTFNNNIILTGTKEADASVRVNGREVVGHDASTTWQTIYSLQPGQNILDITSRDMAGNASDPVTISVDLLPANQRDPDIVGLWHLDGNWLDYSGNGNHATGNGAVFSAELIEGAAAAIFDGSNDYVSISDSASLDVTTAMTLEAWIKPNNVSTYQQIIDKFGTYGDSTYRIGLVPSGQISFDISGNGGAIDYTVSTNAPITQGKWHHVAATFDAGAVKLYVNGVEVASKVSSITVLKAGTSPLNLGFEPTTGRYFNGLMDEVAIYKRALSPEEIRSHYNALPTVTLASPGQTTKYRPGDAGNATVTVNHDPGVSSLICTASGAASGMMTLPFGSLQTAVSQDFAFNVTANAASYATVTLTCSAVDAAGHIGSSSINLTVSDIVAPTVAGASIADHAVNVAATESFTVSFYEVLAQSTVNATSVSLMTDNGTNLMVGGTVTLSPDRKSISFTPATALDGDTPYRLTVSTSVTDMAGNPLTADYVLHFTTQSVTAVSVAGQGTSTAPYVVAAGRYSTISITGSYVVFDGPVAADSLSLTGGSVLTHEQTGLTGAEQLDIAASSITIDAASKIDVTGKGYLGAWQGLNGGLPRTHGNMTSGTSSDYYNGGSYGGLGGIYSGSVNGAYGDLTNLNEPGSGGSGYPTNSSYAGGNGGGLVRIKAGTLSLSGSILADGASATYGSGSGGGILIDVSTLTGSGAIYARGGSSSYGAGGGGRIAVYYDTISLAVANIIASGGQSGNGGNSARNGGAGTIYLKNNGKDKADLIICNNAIVSSVATPVPGGDYGTVDVKGGTLIAMNGSFTTESDIVLTNTQMTINGSIAIPNLLMDNSTLIINGSLKAAGNIVMQNKSMLTHSGATTAVVQMLDITATNVTIDSTSKIDVSGKGYLGGWQGGNNTNTGRTLGNTTDGGSVYNNGGSFGGLGGISAWSGNVNGSYGNPQLPDELGSGGGGNGSSNAGGNGGGLVKISAGTMSLLGSILVDGGTTYVSGGGSGGSIQINVGTLTGSGTISARGGAATANTNYGAGGGGRIAIYYGVNTFPTANITASGGKGGDGSNPARNGGAGTIYLKDNVKSLGDLIVDNRGILTSNTTTVPGGDYGLVDVRGGAAISMNGDLNPGMDMVIAGSQLTVSGGIKAPGNLTIDNSVVTVAGAVNVSGVLELKNQSVLSHYVATTTSQWKLEVTAGSVTVDATSKIDVSGKGYLGGWRGGNNTNTGRTLGNTTDGGSVYTNGGSYGGLGGISAWGGNVNGSYGNPQLPNELGSGGGGNGSSSNAGGNGGGLVKISAGTMSLLGSILADGGTTYVSGGGSGGSIQINVGTLTGSGTISARGGAATANTNYGAGGGGRIAIYYGVNAFPTVNITASGGKGGDGSNTARNGGAGTIYLKDDVKSLGDLIVDNRGIDARDDSTLMKLIGRGAISIITSDSLTMSGSNWTAGAFAGLRINPNVNQSVYFTIKDNTADTIYINSADGNLNQMAAVGDTFSGVFALNQLQILGKARVYTTEQYNVATDVIVDNSVLTASEIYADQLSVTNAGMVTQPSTTTTTAYRLKIDAVTDFTVDATSKIDVSGKGYLGGWQGENNTNTGRTLGNTTDGGSVYTNGGSYGGLGGISAWGGNVNGSYGNPQLPNELGSGGGGNGSSSNAGGNGGGLVKISAGTMSLLGSILVDGGTTYVSGGGSGGSIQINVGTLTGSGTISARGGAATANTNYGAGGGGRIAIYYGMSSFAPENIKVSGGISGNGGTAARNGSIGTIYTLQR
ncbi:Ig-like domain-containing protein [Geotalea uraniireducens]|uniref:LamG domain protein jellyroll fold domain protein n=1 Tax=Geotalea uraniireducens (strain Rf4) TaxID=351605 RepID=A5G5W5_GEOUR|nr:Ig-like domain-containing protein [Geotalea uraniireducens]ABQ27183.1 LamG domain protein jellyroll fold domain protein [Geotalea uraniireducens Rf4]